MSVAIPCYEMHGRGAEFLDHAIQTIASQSYPDLEVVVADHSLDDAVEAVCRRWSARVPLTYVRNPERRGSSSANANAAIRASRGELIKILCQDDYLADETALERVAAAIADHAWLVSSYVHSRGDDARVSRHDPRLTAEIATVNTIGTHSCLTIRNVGEPELFNEDLIWLMDCEYYRRLYERFGPPAVLHEVTMVQRLWEGQVTNTSAAADSLRHAERERVLELHPQPIAGVPSVYPKSSLVRRAGQRLKRLT